MNCIEHLNIDEQKKVQEIELKALIEIDRICRNNNISYSLTGGSLLGAVRHGGFIPWDDDIDIAMLREDFENFQKACKTELSNNFFYQSQDSDNNWFRLYSKIRVNGTVFKELAHCHHDIHHGVYIDVFALDNVPDNKILRIIQSLRFKFSSTILSAKYINPEYRTKKERVLSSFIAKMFFPFSISYLYRRSIKIMTKYNGSKCEYVKNFSGVYGLKEIFPRSFFDETTELSFEGVSLKCVKNYDLVLSQLYGDYMKLPPEDKRISLHRIVELKL